MNLKLLAQSRLISFFFLFWAIFLVWKNRSWSSDEKQYCLLLALCIVFLQCLFFTMKDPFYQQPGVIQEYYWKHDPLIQSKILYFPLNLYILCNILRYWLRLLPGRVTIHMNSNISIREYFLVLSLSLFTSPSA